MHKGDHPNGAKGRCGRAACIYLTLLILSSVFSWIAAIAAGVIDPTLDFGATMVICSIVGSVLYLMYGCQLLNQRRWLYEQYGNDGAACTDCCNLCGHNCCDVCACLFCEPCFVAENGQVAFEYVANPQLRGCNPCNDPGPKIKAGTAMTEAAPAAAVVAAPVAVTPASAVADPKTEVAAAP